MRLQSHGAACFSQFIPACDGNVRKRSETVQPVSFFRVGGRTMDLLTVAIPTLVALFAGLAAGYWMRKSIAESKISSAEEAARQIVDNAKIEAEARQ